MTINIRVASSNLEEDRKAIAQELKAAQHSVSFQLPVSLPSVPSKGDRIFFDVFVWDEPRYIASGEVEAISWGEGIVLIRLKDVFLCLGFNPWERWTAIAPHES